MPFVRKAVIPAAGLGTRFLPATKAQPKEMLPIVDKPTIQYIVEEAVASGIQDILIISGRNKRAIEDHFDRSVELEMVLKEKGQEDLLESVRAISDLAEIHYVRQKEPRGLGHAILCAETFIGNEPFAVLLGDDVIYSAQPCLAQLLEAYQRVHATVLGIQAVPPADVEKYGILDVEQVEMPPAGPAQAVEGQTQREAHPLYRVRGLVEKPRRTEAPSNLAVLGRYIIEPDIFPILRRTPPGAGGEIQLTDALRELARQKPMYGLVFAGQRYDVGDRFGFLQATVEFALRRPELRTRFLSYLREVVADQKE
ncbi:MAG: UTP--glucose-1-phosphate uridylyltransferase GalU [Firmicutes bacterium]|nr:UTP--glucose-1-phosphate uridylyltransferase GalU [Bacillota bacterium]